MKNKFKKYLIKNKLESLLDKLELINYEELYYLVEERHSKRNWDCVFCGKLNKPQNLVCEYCGIEKNEIELLEVK